MPHKPEAPTTWMPLDIGVYLAKTMDLSAEEHGAYLLLIMYYWKNRGPIKNDEKMLANVTKISRKNTMRIISRFFAKTDDFWRHEHIDEQLLIASRQKEKRLNQTSGARAAKEKKQTLLQEQLQGTPLPSPLPVSKEVSSKVETSVSTLEHAGNAQPIASPARKKPAYKITFDYATGQFAGALEEMSQAWADAYPAVDIAAEIAKAKAWMLSKPANRKSDIPAFLNAWLRRAQDGATRPGRTQAERMAAVPMSFDERDKLENDAVMEKLRREYAGSSH